MNVKKEQLKVFIPLLVIMVGVGLFIFKTPSSKEGNEPKKVTVNKNSSERNSYGSNVTEEERESLKNAQHSSEEANSLPDDALLVGQAFVKALVEYDGDQPNSNVENAVQYVTDGLATQMKDASQTVRSSDDYYKWKVRVMDVQSSATDSYAQVKVSGDFYSKAGEKTEASESTYLVYLLLSEGGTWQVSDYAMLRDHDSRTER